MSPRASRWTGQPRHPSPTLPPTAYKEQPTPTSFLDVAATSNGNRPTPEFSLTFTREYHATLRVASCVSQQGRRLSQLRDFAHDYLVETRRTELLEQYLDFHGIDNRANLEKASRQDVRQHFKEWISNQNVPTGDGFSWSKTGAGLPRFRFFLYVDKQTLATVVQLQEEDDGHVHPYFRPLLPAMVVTVVDGSWRPDTVQSYKPQNEDGYPEADDSSKRYVGFEYYNACYATALYEKLHGYGLVNYESYKRPPAIGPAGDQTMS
ncbi:hypothetical protein BDP55DRAFT_633079 [Colletotrichum godetiae]|uniref:Uncharacterized protein n=1 Tax=Colletotrichum godetiae TaxID=1209918 RepID=A0AAJ0AJZ4_9PEZI|nr:uncharacterized protein BDP55DRAFT_633079 [Colletotrichum godetiae]KAK1674645.1 hypothetical protein BDP55DRAFT_633079 [Colletotrichum godetiae]